MLDPSSGSGAFLTGAASILLEIYEEIHNTKVLARSFMTKSGIETLDKWSETAAMRMIIRDNIYGTDKDAQAAKIAQLSMYLLTANNNEPLPDTSNHILAGNSIISDPFVSDDPIDWKTTFPDVLTGDNPGFDIIIGNPPYGAELDDGEKDCLKKTFDIGGTNTAPIFTHQSLRLLKRGGMHGFIVPKSLMYSSQEWATTRETLIDDLVLLANMGKVWKQGQVGTVHIRRPRRFKNHVVRVLRPRRRTYAPTRRLGQGYGGDIRRGFLPSMTRPN